MQSWYIRVRDSVMKTNYTALVYPGTRNDWTMNTNYTAMMYPGTQLSNEY